MQENKVYHSNFLDNKLKAKSAKTIIADPPYYKVKGEFDYVWASFSDYLKDVELWAIEMKRLLSDNGTLFIYGDRKNIAYTQVIFDKYFNLEENVTIHIFDRQTNKIPADDATHFINVTEHLLMYSNEVSQTGLEKIKLDTNNFKPLRNYFELFQKSTGLTKTKILEIVGQSADHCFRWGSSQWDMPTKETYNELLKLPNINELQRQEYETLRQEYETLRQEYETLRRPFNIAEKYKTNVLRISQEGHKTGKYEHDTVKPELLSRILIDATTTDKNDLVLIPFAGSGTECAMAKKENRKYIGFDIEKKYVDMSNNRCRNIGASLF